MRYADVKIEGGPHSKGISVTDAEGQPIKGIGGAEISIRPDDVVRLKLEICLSELKLSGAATFMVADPRTGKMKPVARIEFADGTVFDPTAA
ncbi:hypothetical protein CTI14_00305 [Methylobacterium radiotolerans]|nr:hypothetical protein CTI14_00305 [Methylobacterium radiotolerans]